MQECGGNGLCINNGHSTIDAWNVFWCITNQSTMCSLKMGRDWMERVWCLRHVTCTVCGGWHSPTQFPAGFHPLCSSLSVSVSSTTITLKITQGVWREEREKGVVGERERKRKKRGVMQKRVGKRDKKEKKRLRHLVFPGCLQP